MRIKQGKGGKLHASGVTRLGIVSGEFVYLSREPTPRIAAALAEGWPGLRVIVAPHRVAYLWGFRG